MIYFPSTQGIGEKGNQILHFKTRDRNPITDDTSRKTAAYIKQHFEKSKIFHSDAEILKYAVEQASQVDGFFLEFGVGVGKTTNFIAALAPFRTLHGFDWFEGLPENWTASLPKGSFAFKEKGKFPPLHANVLLHVGLFEDILPTFKQGWLKNDPIALIHVDCDLYTSTKSIFDNLGNNIQSGTIIIFDEYFGYDGWQEHEFKAFQEFIAASGFSYEYLAYNASHQQVVVRIKHKKIGIIFDCDGVLVDTEYLKFLSWQKALHKSNISLSLEEYLPLIGNSSRYIIQKITTLKKIQLDAKIITQQRYEEFAILHKQGVPSISAAVKLVNQLALQKKNLNIFLGLASSAPRKEIMQNLQSVGLTDVFDVIVSGHDDLTEYNNPDGTNKPKPYIYQKTAQILGIHPSQCIVFEDTNAGVTAAINADMVAIAVPNAYTQQHDFSQAAKILKSLEEIDINNIKDLCVKQH
ncbi:MAG: HAD-IA family hydrolase [Candidatus Babeliales bacterium]